MGIDYETKLIYGWEIDYKLLKKFLTEKKAEFCDEDFCPCSGHCWNIKDYGYNCYIICTRPHYDCDLDDMKYFVSLISDNCNTVNIEYLPTDQETINKNKELAILLGAKDMLMIISELNVW